MLYWRTGAGGVRRHGHGLLCGHGQVSVCVSSSRGREDDGQTNSVLFDISVWPSSAVPSQRTADGKTTDRRIMFFFTYLSGRQAQLCAIGRRTGSGFINGTAQLNTYVGSHIGS